MVNRHFLSPRFLSTTPRTVRSIDFFPNICEPNAHFQSRICVIFSHLSLVRFTYFHVTVPLDQGNQFAGDDHQLLLGGLSGIGPLTAKNLEFRGIRVIAAADKGKDGTKFFRSLHVKFEE